VAQKVLHLLVCDLHGDETEGVETISFGLDGATYEVDVCKKHAKEIRDAVGKYVGFGRKVSGRGGARGRGGRRGVKIAGATTADVRGWAIENGYDVGERGRIPSAVVDAYRSAH
jgi:hypothetical protein